MLRKYNTESLAPGDLPHSFLTWGIFDGVHLGHQRVIGETMKLAGSAGGTAVVMTFTFGEDGKAHPRRLFHGTAPSFIMSVPHRLLIFERMQVPACILRPFNTALAAMTPAQFFDKELVARIDVRGIVLGHDAAFGKGRTGTIDTLRELAASHQIEVHSCEPVKFANQPVSSTVIRRAIVAGDLDRAAAMLGRPVSTLGTVVKGTGRGRTLGFPTANLDVHNETCLPRGVYGAIVRVLERGRNGLVIAPGAGREYDAVVNIGVCPTFGPSPQSNSVAEAHILGFEEDIYGRDVEVEYLFRIRDEHKFETATALQAQVEEDIAVLCDFKKRRMPEKT